MAGDIPREGQHQLGTTHLRNTCRNCALVDNKIQFTFFCPMGVSLLPEIRPSSYLESSEVGLPPVKEDIVFQEEGTSSGKGLGGSSDGVHTVTSRRSESLLC